MKFRYVADLVEVEHLRLALVIREVDRAATFLLRLIDVVNVLCLGISYLEHDRDPC
jgi:hypothetical protein